MGGVKKLRSERVRAKATLELTPRGRDEFWIDDNKARANISIIIYIYKSQMGKVVYVIKNSVLYVVKHTI